MSRLGAGIDFSRFRLIGIDPGTSNLGVGVIEARTDTLEIISSRAWTVRAERLPYYNTRAEEVHGERFARIQAIRRELDRILDIEEPEFVFAESPFFFSKRPGAFSALVEVVAQIRLAVYDYHPTIEIEMIPPKSVKEAFTGLGDARKDGMRNVILKLNDLNYEGDIDLSWLDDNAIDGLAIAYVGLHTLRKHHGNYRR